MQPTSNAPNAPNAPNVRRFLWADALTDTPLRPSAIQSETQYANDLALNASHQSVRVNFPQHFEYDPNSGEVSKRFSWFTDFKLDRSLVLKFATGGRCRWRIENETFNKLKNQGYHFEHNDGHGKQNLSTVFMLRMFLAFLVDQVQQACCPLFAAVLEKFKSRRVLWASYAGTCVTLHSTRLLICGKPC